MQFNQLPVIIVCSPLASYPGDGGAYARFPTSSDIAGLVIAGVGYLIEMVADVDRAIWQQKHGRNSVMKKRLWVSHRVVPVLSSASAS